MNKPAPFKTLVLPGACLLLALGLCLILVIPREVLVVQGGRLRVLVYQRLWPPSLRSTPSHDQTEAFFDAVAQRKLPRCLAASKSSKQMRYFASGVLRGTYRIDLGWNPVEVKTREGDGCTPEGAYFICTKNPRSRFHLSLGISYPGPEDIRRGAATGLISRETASKLHEQAGLKSCPPWNTPLGGEIMIHGFGSGQQLDVTNGCLAVTNQEIDLLYKELDVGDAVFISW